MALKKASPKKPATKKVAKKSSKSSKSKSAPAKPAAVKAVAKKGPPKTRPKKATAKKPIVLDVKAETLNEASVLSPRETTPTKPEPKVVTCEVVDENEDKPAKAKPAGSASPVKGATAEPVEAEEDSEVVVPVVLDEDGDEPPDEDFPEAPVVTGGSSKNLPATPGSRAVSTADPITAYLNEVRRYPLLTREQELELAKRYYDTKDPAAAQALVTANLRFVVKVAAEYSKFGAKLIDLVQEGNMGLMHAVRDFNPYKGNRLITYAVWWIRGYIQEYLLKQYSMVKIATTLNQKKLFYRLQKEKEALDQMGEHPDFKLIGERMGIPEEEVEQMANRLSGRDVSLNTPLDDSASSSLMDLQKAGGIAVDEQIGAFEELELLKEKLSELRDELSEREKIILEERILADDPLTLQEIGEKYGITREAVRQTEARLMKKIKDKYMAGSPAVDDEG